MPPTPLSYRGVPTGEIAVTEAAIEALAGVRRWGVLLQVLLFIYAGAGLLLGVYTFVIIFINRGRAEFALSANLVVALGGLLFGGLALVGAVLLVRFTRAARRTISLRRPEDLERTVIALARFWRVAVLAVIALGCYPVGVVGVAVILNVFP